MNNTSTLLTITTMTDTTVSTIMVAVSNDEFVDLSDSIRCSCSCSFIISAFDADGWIERRFNEGVPCEELPARVWVGVILGVGDIILRSSLDLAEFGKRGNYEVGIITNDEAMLN
jgi:hypothetical protein